MIEMNGIMKTVTAAALSLAAACLTGPAAGAGTPGNEAGDKNLSVHSISMNRICKEWDGQWQGMPGHHLHQPEDGGHRAGRLLQVPGGLRHRRPLYHPGSHAPARAD